MDHKKSLNSEELNQKLQFLKKQRDGLIIGDYRNILSNLYSTITSIINTNENIYCSVDMIYEKYYAKNNHEKNIIIDYCLDLEQLGYICIDNYGKVFILKKLDF